MTPLDSKYREGILTKIRACFRLGDTNRNPSEEEAATAIRMAKKLMAEHNLSQAEVMLAEGTEEVPDNIVEESELGHRLNPTSYEVMLTVVCQHLFNVKPIRKYKWESSRHRQYMVFIGYEADVLMAKEVYAILRKDLYDMSQKNGFLGREGDQYRLGLVHTLIQRAKEEASGLSKEDENRCRSLVVVKDRKVQAWVDQQYGRLKTSSRGSSNRQSSSYQAGREDGKKISLDFSKKLS